MQEIIFHNNCKLCKKPLKAFTKTKDFITRKYHKKCLEYVCMLERSYNY